MKHFSETPKWCLHLILYQKKLNTRKFNFNKIWLFIFLIEIKSFYLDLCEQTNFMLLAQQSFTSNMKLLCLQQILFL